MLPELTDTFLELASTPVTVSEAIMLLIEKFVVLWYDKQVNLEQLMKQDNIFSVDDPEHCKIYLQLQLLFDSTLYVPCIRLDMSEGSHFEANDLRFHL